MRRQQLRNGLIALFVSLLALVYLRRRPELGLEGRVVLITGSSRGLGFVLARLFARHGCRIVICARNKGDLERARRALAEETEEVLAIPCDVADEAQVAHLVEEATRHFGQIDILVNNAGIMQAAPFESTTRADFREALDVMFWGVLNPIWAVLPQMMGRRQGHIVNITSIGGKVSIPHLLPYNSAKFAAVGLSEGLQAELGRHGIDVITIVPGLMRTGSYLNAYYKGKYAAEFSWFGASASLPLLTMDVERAAEQIVAAVQNRKSVRTLTLPAILLERFHGLFPGLTGSILTFVNRWILPADGPGWERMRGVTVQAQLQTPRRQIVNALTVLGRRAARRFQQFSPTPSQIERPEPVETPGNAMHDGR